MAVTNTSVKLEYDEQSPLVGPTGYQHTSSLNEDS